MLLLRALPFLVGFTEEGGSSRTGSFMVVERVMSACALTVAKGGWQGLDSALPDATPPNAPALVHPAALWTLESSGSQVQLAGSSALCPYLPHRCSAVRPVS